MFPEEYATHTDSFHPESPKPCPDMEPLEVDSLKMDFLDDSDLEFLETTFDLKDKEELEKMIEMDETEFHHTLEEKEIAECMEDLIQGVEAMAGLERKNSLELIDDDMILSGPMDMTVFNSDCDTDPDDTDSVVSSDDEVTNLEEVTTLQQEVLDLEDCLEQQREAAVTADAALKRKEEELERMKHQYRMDMERVRKRMEHKRPSYGESTRPIKRSRVERRGCPFCPFEQTTTGYDMRCLKDHMTNGDCECLIDDMTSRPCSHPNVWCEEGESGWQSLKNMGFKDPDNHVLDFRHFSCPQCDFTHWHARKFKRHLMAGINRGGCAYSKEEAENIKNDQLKRKIMAKV
jgi:hypothetical protein